MREDQQYSVDSQVATFGLVEKKIGTKLFANSAIQISGGRMVGMEENIPIQN